MNPRYSAMMLALLLGAGCSRNGEPAITPEAAQTRAYLQQVARIGSLASGDYRERIPPMIRGHDLSMLGAQGAQLREHMRVLAALGSSGVDPDALKFTHNLRALLEAYASLCQDTAELFREVRAGGPRLPGAPGPSPAIAIAPVSSPDDTIGTVDVLLQSLERTDLSAKDGEVFLAPIVGRVRADWETLRSAQAAQDAFTLKFKAELKERYPGIDWTSKELFP
jgi:hypothetical protein